MNKHQYYLHAMNTSLYGSRDWVYSAFSACSTLPTIHDATYDYQIVQDHSDPEALFYASEKIDGKRVAVKIIGSTYGQALYREYHPVLIHEGDIPLKLGHETVDTTYGIILGNMYLLYYPFNTKFNFFNGIITNKFESKITELLVDDIDDVSKEDPSKIYVREIERYGEACQQIVAFDRLFASPGSEKALLVDPKVLQLRDQLLKQHKGNLLDTRVQAEIESQLVAADKASFKDDREGRNFLISGKSFNPTRKKQLIMIGGSSGFGDDGEASFIPKSLNDGWSVEDIPLHANEARSGSYFRGKETASGGADVKVATRMTMDTEITEDFCGTVKGISETITKSEQSKYIGRYVVTKDGPVLLTSENISDYLDKPLQVYSPQMCKTQGVSYCAVCIGEPWNGLRQGLTNAVSNIGDVFMYDKMKRMHGKALVKTRFPFKTHIS